MRARQATYHSNRQILYSTRKASPSLKSKAQYGSTFPTLLHRGARVRVSKRPHRGGGCKHARTFLTMQGIRALAAVCIKTYHSYFESNKLPSAKDLRGSDSIMVGPTPISFTVRPGCQVPIRALPKGHSFRPRQSSSFVTCEAWSWSVVPTRWSRSTYVRVLSAATVAEPSTGTHMHKSLSPLLQISRAIKLQTLFLKCQYFTAS